ncbi:MAG: hypothetical protein AB1416_04135 [Actinomycetota bacterium]
MSPRPDPRAELRAFAALVLEMARVDPHRRPSAEISRWHRELASVLDIIPERADTNRELVDETLRMHRLVAQRDRSRTVAAA